MGCKALSAEVLWLEKPIARAVTTCITKARRTKSYAEECVNNCPESEYSENKTSYVKECLHSQGCLHLHLFPEVITIANLTAGFIL